jgi:excisionase family DNA binding protein
MPQNPYKPEGPRKHPQGERGPERELHDVLDELVDLLAERVAARVQARLFMRAPEESPWLTTREAADHLGMHPDTLRRLAAERAIPSEQDGPDARCTSNALSSAA